MFKRAATVRAHDTIQQWPLNCFVFIVRHPLSVEYTRHAFWFLSQNSCWVFCSIYYGRWFYHLVRVTGA